jgi:hypothetical protein
MRVMKFAVVLCFTAAFVMLVNDPHPVASPRVATKAPTVFSDGLGRVYTSMDVSAVICANCHQNLNHIAPLFSNVSDLRCSDCHQIIVIDHDPPLN